MQKTSGNTVSVITMGCSKNTVDSEVLMRQLEENRFTLSDDPNTSDILIINTCGFIDSAKEESVNTILEATELKRAGKIKKLYVAGCLSERYADDLKNDIPEVDRYFGVTDFKAIMQELGGDFKYELLGERHLTTPSHYGYIKISEGCDNPCSFCAIPIMRGGHVSVSMEEIVHEAKFLALHGVKELIVIGQDTTYYGKDLYGKRSLAELLNRLSDVEGIEWIRLMYAYPSQFPLDALDVIRERSNICNYIDVPIQHIHDGVLKSMRRGITKRATIELIDTIRQRIPGVTLRTTLITGYPNETEEAYDELYRFVEDTQFDRLGVFTYSDEDNTVAAMLGDPIPEETKEERRAEIMELQTSISQAKNEVRIGTTEKVLIDRIEGEYAIGRTERDAPEVDNEVLVPIEEFSGDPLIGTFYSVRITDANEFDITGTLRTTA